MFIPLGMKHFLFENVGVYVQHFIYIYNLVGKHFIWPINW